MKVIVTGLESSGTRWVTELLQRHPDSGEVIHTSIPEYLMIHDIKTRWPVLTGADFVVWMLRYEPFRLQSIASLKYDDGRAPEFLPPELYQQCARLYAEVKDRVLFTSYSGLLGPLGFLVFQDLLERMHLDPARFPANLFVPKDGNRKYWS